MTPNALNRRRADQAHSSASAPYSPPACRTITTAGTDPQPPAKRHQQQLKRSTSNNTGSGEYRKADAKGPARTSQTQRPENGYRAKTPTASTKTMDAWNQWINYGIQTGDYSKAHEFLSSTNDGELKIYRK